MLIYKKTSTLAIRHVIEPEVMSAAAEVALKDGLKAGASLLGHAAEEAAGKLAGEMVKKIAEKVRSHLTNHSERLSEALTRANAKAWKTIEIALGGSRFWDHFASAEDKALRGEVQAFLASGIMGDNPGFLTHCLRELREARSKGHLGAEEGFDATWLAAEDSIGPFARFDDPEALLAAECTLVGQIAGEFQALGYRHLGRLLAITPNHGQPLLATAVQYYFQRAIGEDPILARELTWVKLIAIDRRVEDGLARLALFQERHAIRLEEALEGLARVEIVAVETRDVVLELRAEIRALAERVNLAHRRLTPDHSFSIRDDHERWLIAQVLAKYRALDDDRRQRLPELGVDLSGLAIVAGDYDSALTLAREAARRLEAPNPEARAHHAAFRAALELERWDEAHAALTEAARANAVYAIWPRPQYLLERILGAGAFGVALLCLDTYVNRRVVIKTSETSGLDRDIGSIFDEARTLDALRHPGIIHLNRCGFVDEVRRQRPFMEVEYVPDSISLRDYVRGNGAFASPDEFLPVALQMAEALNAAHDAGVCHRDVKPGNLLVRKSSRGWDVKLIDFGLSLRPSLVQVSRARTAFQGRSMVGSAVAGTFDYAAPEQFDAARTHQVGPHSDVYGFAKTCYFGLFGEPVPDQEDLELLPAPWKNLLARCVSRRLDRRPANFAEVLDGLRAIRPAVMTGVPSIAVPAPPSPVNTPKNSERAAPKPPTTWEGLRAGDLKILRAQDQEIRFIWCPPTSQPFLMGSPKQEEGRFTDEDQVEVTLTRGFWMQDTQVTQGLWRAVMGTTLAWSEAPRASVPVFNVNHVQASSFSERLTQQLHADGQLPSGWKVTLPTEAQWEYAARADTTTRYPFGTEEASLGEYAWYSGNSGGKPHEVKTRKPNGWGLHDMLGNVREWCADGYQIRLPGGEDPCVRAAKATCRVIRGGCWFHDPSFCRPAYRNRGTPELRSYYLGFRVAAVREWAEAGTGTRA